MRKGSLQSKFLVKVGILSQRGGLGGWLVWPNPNFLKPKPQPYKTVILLGFCRNMLGVPKYQPKKHQK